MSTTEQQTNTEPKEEPVYDLPVVAQENTEVVVNREERRATFIEALFDESVSNGDPKIAANIAGYPPGYNLSQILNGKEVRKAIRDRCEDFLVLNGPRAVIELTKILGNPTAKGAKIRRDVAIDVLDRIGIIKKLEEQTPQVVVPNVTIILPSKNEY